jgi:hypothetical protein
MWDIHLMNAMKSSYVLLNYEEHKKFGDKDVWNLWKIYTISLPYLKKQDLWVKIYALMVFTDGYRGWSVCSVCFSVAISISLVRVRSKIFYELWVGRVWSKCRNNLNGYKIAVKTNKKWYLDGHEYH